MEMFEKASRNKLRFETTRGSLSTEELWDLSLESLDTMAKKVNKQIQEEGEVSFIPNKVTRPNCTNNALRLEILKHIIETKSAEKDAAKNRSEQLAKLQQLKELAEKKSLEQLGAQSLEDLNKQIAQLEASVG